MRLNVSAWSIRRPIPAVVAFAVLTILGLVSFRTMSITRFPNIDIPIVRVLIAQSGAAPSELESQVTKKVEDAVSSINGVWHIVSMVTDGSSSTIVQFTVGSVDIDRALNDVKDQIAKISSRSAAHHRRAGHQPHRYRGPADRHLRRLGAGALGRATVLVHRRFGRARSAEHPRRRRGRAVRRRRSRNPRRARSGKAIGARRHRGDRQRAGARRQRRSRRRTRRARRPGAGDPHARWRAKARRSRGAADRAPGRAQRSGSTNSRPSPTAPPSRAPSRACSTSRSSPSA